MTKKTTDDELNQWRYRYPSAGVAWNFVGDPVYGHQHIGEAKIMLYKLKNRMNLAVPKLKSFQDIHRALDGTIIVVKSIFGQDIVEIDVTQAIAGAQKCTITFINFPLYVPPMRNPGKIKDGEVEGVDYFKTYYAIDISRCPACQKISWEFLFKYLQSSPLVPPTVPISTREEWPIEPLHHQTFDADGKLIDEDVTDHTIYSLSPPAWGELIDFGTDEKGTYIIWKAYTESGDGVIYSRSGLAIMRLVARIRNEKGEEICAQNERIEVDCCKKIADLREVEIWWEGIWECQPFIIYGDLHLCKTPTSLAMGGMSGLNWYACMHPYQPFYSLPDIRGVCLPVEWTLSGPIDFRGSNKNDDTIYIKCLGGGCTEKSLITLRDRCGGEYSIHVRSCCEDAGALEIHYSSISMGCGMSQNLFVTGGCGPYTWSASTGELSEEEGSSTVYTAPSENVGCLSNPTVEVMDCCGNSTSVKFAVSCMQGSGALYLWHWEFSQDVGSWCNGLGPFVYGRICTKEYYTYDCYGDYEGNVMSNNVTFCERENCCDMVNVACLCSGSEGCDTNTSCAPPSVGEPECNELVDARTQEAKNGGCCPVNPITGLPYD